MKLEFIIAAAFLCIGFATGLAIPPLADKMVRYKCAKRNKEIPGFSLRKLHKMLLISLNAVLFASAGLLMPLPEACLACVFTYTALVSVVIDARIRIICNEMVLLIFAAGIAYRIVAGGIASLLGSLAAFGIVLVIFGGAAAVSKLLTKSSGVGAGDVKLALAISVAVGYPGVLTFLFCMAVALGGYCVIGLMSRYLTKKMTFAMCGYIMFGFLAALIVPYIPYIPYISM